MGKLFLQVRRQAKWNREKRAERRKAVDRSMDILFINAKGRNWNGTHVSLSGSIDRYQRTVKRVGIGYSQTPKLVPNGGHRMPPLSDWDDNVKFGLEFLQIIYFGSPNDNLLLRSMTMFLYTLAKSGGYKSISDNYHCLLINVSKIKW